MNDKPRVRYHNGALVNAAMFDSLSNVVAGIGTEKDKRSHNVFGYGFNVFNWVELEAAYTENWIARDIVNIPIDDGLREWRRFNVDDATAIVKEEKRLNVLENYKLARYWSGLYGGSVIIMITDQDLGKELDVERIKQGSLKRLVVLDRWDVQPQDINYIDPIREDYLMPQWYQVFGGVQRIHSSHIIRCDGEEMPRRMKALNQGWGDSRLRRVMEDLKDVVSTKGGIASLVLEANVDSISREGLSDELASGQEEAILKRFALAGQLKSLVNMMLLDGSETYERKSITFGGLAQIMDEFMVWISGATDIPMTRFFGTSSKGMNATGEGDMRNYHDSVASDQECKYRPDLERLDEVLIRSAMGEKPEDFSFEWNPLYKESGTELAQQDLAKSQTEDILLEQGAISVSNVMQRLKSENRYAISEQEINERQKIEKEEKAFEKERREDPDFGLGEEEEKGGASPGGPEEGK